MMAQEPRSFVLQEIDPSTGSALAEMRIRISDLLGLRDILGDNDDPDLNGSYELEPGDLHRIGSICVPPLDLDPRLNVLEPWHSIRQVPYLVHTGFELLLMLEGRKPLAMFHDVRPAPWLDETLQRFEPYVQAGRFVRRIIDTPLPNDKLRLMGFVAERRALFALPAEVWRIDAYLDLWRTAEMAGWSDALERSEGALLGYEDWQNDWWIEHRRQQLQMSVEMNH